jgi:hypothetical protein
VRYYVPRNDAKNDLTLDEFSLFVAIHKRVITGQYYEREPNEEKGEEIKENISQVKKSTLNG